MNLLALAIYNAGLAVIMIVAWGATDVAIHLIGNSNATRVESLQILSTLFRVTVSFFTSILLVLTLANAFLNAF